MAEGGWIRGYARAFLRGVVQAIPVLGPAFAECLKHADEKKLQRQVEELVQHVARREPGRTSLLAGLPEPEVERAVAEGIARIPDPERACLAEAVRRDGRDSALAADGALKALVESPAVRHSLLTYACEHLGQGKPLSPGERIEARYEILEMVGVGGMGVVYRARDMELDEVVALKFLRSELLRNEAVARRFLQEAKLCLSLTHEGIVRVRDVRKANGVPYLTMEWVEGPTLRTLLVERGRFTWDEEQPLIKALLVVLAYAHEKGVLHLDLKPENVLVPTLGAPKLCDFGLARALAWPGGNSLLLGAGTPQYMAPEQLSCGAVDARTDVYALGVILYEVLSGRLPGRRSPTLSEGFGVTEGVSDAVEAALAENPSDRPADAGAFLLALAPPSSVGILQGQAVDPPPLVAKGARSRKRRPLEAQGKRGQVGRVSNPVAQKVEEAIAEIERRGGKIERDTSRPGGPVVGLDAKGSAMTDAGLTYVQQFPELRSLDVSYTAVSDAGMSHVSGLQHLESLNLGCNKIGDKGIAALSGLTRLRILDLSRTKITSSAMEHLSSLTNLEILDLHNTQVDDDGLRHLQGLSRLRELTISCTEVSDTGLQYIKEVKALRKLRIGANQVTGAGIEMLLEAIRGLTVQ